MTHRASAIVVSLAIALSACVSTATVNRERLDDIRRRAAFDLHCDAGQLAFTPLKETDGIVVQYGVEGCGHRSAYVHTWRGWVLNASDEGGAAK